MCNQVIIIGRLVDIFEEEFILRVLRTYKDDNDEYGHDDVPVKMGKSIHDNMIEYCKVGDTVAVKGRLESVTGNLYVVVDKLTFLSSAKGGE